MTDTNNCYLSNKDVDLIQSALGSFEDEYAPLKNQTHLEELYKKLSNISEEM